MIDNDIKIFKMDKRFKLYKYGFRYCLESEYYIRTTLHLCDVFNLNDIDDYYASVNVGGKISEYAARRLPDVIYAYDLFAPGDRNKSRFYLREEEYFLYMMSQS